MINNFDRYIESNPKSNNSFGINVNSFLSSIKTNNTKAPTSTNNTNKYVVGMYVKHKKFGTGVIQKIEPEDDDLKLDIMFEQSGFKRLMANYTPLEIVK